jgi:DNA-binding XRE family transcriptional regulator
MEQLLLNQQFTKLKVYSQEGAIKFVPFFFKSIVICQKMLYITYNEKQIKGRKIMTKKVKFTSYDDYLNMKLKTDPEFKEEYDNLEDEYNLIRAIINLRLEANLTQAEMAKLTGIDQGNISKLENGRLNPSFEMLEKLAKPLNKKVKITFE